MSRRSHLMLHALGPEGIEHYRTYWVCVIVATWIFNTMRPRPKGRYFADDIFNWIFANEYVWILTKISLKFVPRGAVTIISALVQTMVWCWPCDTPLSEPTMVSLPTHICVTRPQWVKLVLSLLNSREVCVTQELVAFDYSVLFVSILHCFIIHWEFGWTTGLRGMCLINIGFIIFWYAVHYITRQHSSQYVLEPMMHS